MGATAVTLGETLIGLATTATAPAATPCTAANDEAGAGALNDATGESTGEAETAELAGGGETEADAVRDDEELGFNAPAASATPTPTSAKATTAGTTGMVSRFSLIKRIRKAPHLSVLCIGR
ncbi:MAG TPA: hypothetical protein VK662_13880 [Acidothermaceae bacterium]|nr:hypothetical protein [Acidothermaceae bacterium]